MIDLSGSLPKVSITFNRPIHIPIQTSILNVRYRFDTPNPNDYVAIFEKITKNQIKINIHRLDLEKPIPSLRFRISGGPLLELPADSSYPRVITYPDIYLVLPDSMKPQQVPRTIVQTWKSHIVPKSFEFTVNVMKDLNPEYSYILYDDKEARDFIVKHYNNHIVKAYDTLKPPAYKADLFRYCYLYKHGGVYIDMKTVLQVPLHSVIGHNTPLVLSQEVLPAAISNFFLATAPNNPFLAYLIKRVCWSIVNREKGVDMWDITGCTAFGRCLNNHLNLPERAEFTLKKMPYLYKLHNVQEAENRMSVRTSLRQVVAYKNFSTYYDIHAQTKYHGTAWDHDDIFTETQTGDSYFEESYFHENLFRSDFSVSLSSSE